MKRVGDLYGAIAEPENLRLAFWKAQRGKAGKRDVLAFRQDLDARLGELRRDLLSGDVRVGEYKFFIVHDPKERLICAASFRERVLHHALMNVCGPVFERFQIHDSYASRTGKGTYAALARARCFTRRHGWYLKLDVRKYFDTVSHDVLKDLLRRLFKDRLLVRLLDALIDSYCSRPGQGLPVGNLTSQYFANHYLAVADHYLESLRVPGYVRYMDDMILWHDHDGLLMDAGRAFGAFLGERLRLELKPPCMNRGDRGLPFLGYLVYPETIRLNARSRRRFVHGLHACQDALARGSWSQAEFARHVLALVSFTGHANARGFRRKVMAGMVYPA